MSDNRTLTVTIVGNAASAEQALGRTGKAVDSIGQKSESTGKSIRSGIGSALSQVAQQGGVLAPLSEIFDKLGEAQEQAGEKSVGLGKRMMAIGAIGAGLGAALAAEGSKDQAAQQQLSQAIDNTGKSYDDYKEEIEKTITSQAKFGHGAVDTQNALQVLTQATNDPKKALEEMGVAADLAAAKHESLTAASDQLAKILGGKGTRTLASFGISLKDASGATKTHAQLVEELAKKLSGQASAASDTFSGKLAALRTEIGNNVAAIGQKYGPGLTALGGVVTVAGAAFQTAAGMAAKLGQAGREAADAAKALQVAELVATGATQAEAEAQVELDAAMDANPIGLIVLAIAALVGGLVLAYENSKTFRDIVNNAFSAVSKAASFMWNNVLKPTFKFIAQTFLDVAGTIVHAAANAFGWIPGIGGHLKDAAKSFDDFAASVNNSLGNVHDQTATLTVLKTTVDVGAHQLYGGPGTDGKVVLPNWGSDPIEASMHGAQAAAATIKRQTWEVSQGMSLPKSSGGGGGGGGNSTPKAAVEEWGKGLSSALGVGAAAAKVAAALFSKALGDKKAALLKDQDAEKAYSAILKKTLSDRTNDLNAAIQAQAAYTKSITDAASASTLAGITGAKNADGTTAAITNGDIATSLAGKLANLQKFIGEIKQLGAFGLAKSLMSQIFAMGPDVGEPYAAAILAGGQAAINTDNSLQGAIDASGADLGAYASSNQGFDAAVASAQTQVNNVTVQVAGSVTTESDLAKAIAKIVKEQFALDSKRNGK